MTATESMVQGFVLQLDESNVDSVEAMLIGLVAQGSTTVETPSPLLPIQASQTADVVLARDWAPLLRLLGAAWIGGVHAIVVLQALEVL